MIIINNECTISFITLLIYDLVNFFVLFLNIILPLILGSSLSTFQNTKTNNNDKHQQSHKCNDGDNYKLILLDIFNVFIIVIALWNRLL